MLYRNSIILFSLSFFLVACSARYTDPDLNRNLEQLILSRGFKCEIHEVTTDDGYILGYYRIVNPATIENPELRKRPVLIHHGLLSSGTDFVINSPGGDYDPSILDQIDNGVDVDARGKFIEINGNFSGTKEVSSNLGFALANFGYDVWLGNSRGNTFSKKHTHLDVKDKKFWKFSTDDMIAYDLPAAIDYILKTSGRDNLAYVGHSQGSLIMFGLLATRPEYTEKIKPFIAFGPVAAFVEMKGLGGFITKMPIITEILKHMEGQFLPASSVLKAIAKAICSSPIKSICTNLIFLIGGYDPPQMNVTREPVYMTHAPSGTSWKNMCHYSQMVKARQWQMFDYGVFENELRYGTPYPPKYNLESIRSKYIALMYGENDLIATPNNVAAIKSHLRVPLLDDYLVPFPQWNHVDFMWGMEAGKYVNSRVIDNIKIFDT